MSFELQKGTTIVLPVQIKLNGKRAEMDQSEQVTKQQLIDIIQPTNGENYS